MINLCGVIVCDQPTSHKTTNRGKMKISGFNPQIDICVIHNVMKDPSTTTEQQREVIFRGLGSGHSVENLTSGCEEELVCKIKEYAQQRQQTINSFIDACNKLYVKKCELLSSNHSYLLAKNQLQFSREIFKILNLNPVPIAVEGIRPDVLKKFKQPKKETPDLGKGLKSSHDNLVVEKESNPIAFNHIVEAVSELAYIFSEDPGQFDKHKEKIKEVLSVVNSPKVLSEVKNYFQSEEEYHAFFMILENEFEKQRYHAEDTFMDLLTNVQNAYDNIEGDRGYCELKFAKKECFTMLESLSMNCSKEELLNHERLTSGAKSYLSKKILFQVAD